MFPGRRVSPLAIDLSLVQQRSVTSLYSNLVTRPTGRAIRTGVESQIGELDGERTVCLSILDFAQVRVLDYSCADEIVAKLLLRYQATERPAEAFFLARGVQEHHREPIEEVLRHHGLLLVVEGAAGAFELLGGPDPLQRACWTALLQRSRTPAAALAAEEGIAPEAASAALLALAGQRVVVAFTDATFVCVPRLLDLLP